MKKILFIIAITFTMVLSSYAQSNSNRISFGVGILYERGFDATISWEHETKNHNAWEYFINGYLKWDTCESDGHVCPESFWNNYRTWGLGVAYKPCITRARNNYGNIRIGASAGSDTDKFIAGIHVGYEHNFALRNGWVLYLQAKCDMILPDREDLFREGITIGFKIPSF